MREKREPDKSIVVRELFAFAGLSLVTTGCALYSLPLGLIVCGVMLTYLGLWHR